MPFPDQLRFTTSFLVFTHLRSALKHDRRRRKSFAAVFSGFDSTGKGGTFGYCSFKVLQTQTSNDSGRLDVGSIGRRKTAEYNLHNLKVAVIFVLSLYSKNNKVVGRLKVTYRLFCLGLSSAPPRLLEQLRKTSNGVIVTADPFQQVQL